MENTLQNNRKQVAYWLLLGVFMIIIQVVIGGITRLTESGLSITEWKPITGTLPPLNETAWMAEFDKYRNTDQFKYVHQHFSLSDFKFIFFWEWFHRVWARLLGVVFLIGFVYFIARKKFDKSMIRPMIVLFILGGLQGLVGWIMVKSGLVPEKFYVGHVELTTHLIAALVLLVYTAWFAFSLLPSMQQKLAAPSVRKYLLAISVLLLFQLIYGGFMAGLKAAATAPTWPDINGQYFPKAMLDDGSLANNLLNNPIMVHFMHRGIAYLLLIVVIAYFMKARKFFHHSLFARLNTIFLLLFIVQVALGIFTVLNATNKQALVWLGVSHQFIAMMIVLNTTALFSLTVRQGYRGRESGL
ncbi:MAG: heme A synthase [Chitinophagaceae bacterium]|nr:MAG: heme A synthase [Chitinophagaceae bacterium]